MELLAAEAAGAAVGVAAGAGELAGLASPALLELESAPEAVAPAPSLELLAAGLAEEYRSLYQPEPLNCTAAAVSVRSNTPPQCGQVVRGASESFWIFSTRRWHC